MTKDNDDKPVRTSRDTREARQGLIDYRSLGSQRVAPVVEPSIDDERVEGTFSGSLKDIFG